MFVLKNVEMIMWIYLKNAMMAIFMMAMAALLLVVRLSLYMPVITTFQIYVLTYVVTALET